MPSSPVHGLHSLADQRYYHFVALQGAKLTLAAYWRRFNAGIHDPKSTVNATDAHVTLQHRKWRSNGSYARGAVSVELSENGEGRSPFFYDLIAMQARVGGVSFLIIGFPFASLALDVFKNVLGTHHALGSGPFVAADVSGLVVTMESGFQKRYEGLNVHTVGVQFSVSEDKYLSNVRLGGDDPLAAEIYQGFLKERLKKGYVLPDRCTLACERVWDARHSSREPERLLRSRIHFDNNGNFRVYAQAGCANLMVLPYALGQLHSAGLLREVTQNPLLRLREDSPD